MRHSRYANSSVSKVALEIISMQETAFGENIEKEISSIVADIDNNTIKTSKDIVDLPAIKNIEQLIYKRLGMSVKLVVDNKNIMAALLPLYLHMFNPQSYKNIRGGGSIKSQEEFIKNISTKGTVDTKTAKLGGVFSTYQHRLYLNIFRLSTIFNMTAGEITAVMLHELGHGFNSLEYSHRLASTSVVLEDLANHVKGNDGGETSYVYNKLQLLDKSTTKELAEEIVDDRTNTVLNNTILNVLSNVTTSAESNSYLDTTSEQSADLFATRFGYGRQLIIGVDKLETTLKNIPDYIAPLSNGFMQFLVFYNMTVSVFAFFLGFLLASSYMFILGIIMSVIASLLNTSLKESVGPATNYDDAYNRYKRIRSDVVRELKNSELSKKEIEPILESIYSIDSILKTVKSDKVFLHTVNKILSRNEAIYLNNKTKTQLMESLANNELFVKSAEFKTL